MKKEINNQTTTKPMEHDTLLCGVCSKCKYFRISPHKIIAPISPLDADGVCENPKWKQQPIVLDSKTDTCEWFLNAT